MDSLLLAIFTGAPGVYYRKPRRHQQPQKEYKACLDAGLEAYIDTAAPLPFIISAALRIENQAQFNPMQYIKALAAQVQGTGCTVFEHTPVIRIQEGSPNILYTANGTVTAGKVIHATHSPKGV